MLKWNILDAPNMSWRGEFVLDNGKRLIRRIKNQSPDNAIGQQVSTFNLFRREARFDDAAEQMMIEADSAGRAPYP